MSGDHNTSSVASFQSGEAAAESELIEGSQSVDLISIQRLSEDTSGRWEWRGCVGSVIFLTTWRYQSESDGCYSHDLACMVDDSGQSCLVFDEEVVRLGVIADLETLKLPPKVEMKIALVNGLILIPLFTLLGVPGNIVSAVVFYKQGLRERINLCLFALAIVDLVVVLDLFFPYFESQIRILALPHAWFFATKAPGLIGFVWASHFLSAVIASERCFCVVSPFHAKRLLKTSTMAAIIGFGCFILIGVMCAIAGPKHTVVNFVDPLTNNSWEIFSVTRYYLENQRIFDTFDIFVYGTFLPGFFLLVVIITSVITTVSLRSAVYKRQTMTIANDRKTASIKSPDTLSSREVALTRMLIGMSVIFIVCIAPNLVHQVTTFFVPDLSFTGKYSSTNFVLWGLVSFLRVFNSSVNICVYYTLGSKFRQSLHEICRHCKINCYNTFESTAIR